MAQNFKFSPDQAKTIIKVINNLCVAGSQIMQMDQPDVWHKACANLRELQKNNREFFLSLDEIGKSLMDEIGGVVFAAGNPKEFRKVC